MKSQAMVLEAFRQPLVMREFIIPPLKAGEVLVQIEAAGVCGSDVHMYWGEDARVPLPIILGHEGIGRIVAINGTKASVNGEPLQLGDRILWTRGITCNHCYACAILNKPWLCQNRQIYGINRSSAEPPYINGCYSEYVILLDGVDVFLLMSKIEPAVLVSASCSGATIANAFDQCPLRPGDTILVQGSGPLGLYAIAYAKWMGASKVFVIGSSGKRLEICDAFGADCILDINNSSSNERQQQILELTNGLGVDLVIEAVGQPSAVVEGLSLVRPGGTYITVGFSQPPGSCSVDFYKDVVSKNVRIQGVWAASTRHTQQALSLVETFPHLFAKMVTHRYGLAEANAALAAMVKNQAVKAVLLPRG